MDRHAEGAADSAHRDRAQVILIGAIALAFIIIGIVVVYNGVLYTETLSSADTGQSASIADKTALEIEQGVGCVLAENGTEDDIEAFGDQYRNATAHSSPAVVMFEDVDVDASTATITLTYDSSDLSYEQQLDITDEDCPEER